MRISLYTTIYEKVTFIVSDENNNHQNNLKYASNITQINKFDNACSPQMEKYIK